MLTENAIQQIKYVSFDIGGTLITPNPSVGAVYAEVLADHRVTIQPAALQVRFELAMKTVPRGQDGRISEESERQFWFEVVKESVTPFYPGDHLEEFFNDLYGAFASSCRWKLLDGVRHTLEELSRRGFRLLAVSNADARFRSVLDGLRLLNFFDGVFLSSEAGYAKPDPRIFEHARNTLSAAPESILHIGDSAQEDVLGAFEAGWHSLLLDQGNPPENGKSIQRLDDLLVILRRGCDCGGTNS